MIHFEVYPDDVQCPFAFEVEDKNATVRAYLGRCEKPKGHGGKHLVHYCEYGDNGELLPNGKSGDMHSFYIEWEEVDNGTPPRSIRLSSEGQAGKA